MRRQWVAAVVVAVAVAGASAVAIAQSGDEPLLQRRRPLLPPRPRPTSRWLPRSPAGPRTPTAFLSGAIGGGLTFAAVSNTCMMGSMLAKLPFNRAASADIDTAIAELVK